MTLQYNPLLKWRDDLLMSNSNLFEVGCTVDITDKFYQWINSTIKNRGIITLAIKGFMRSSKSMVTMSISHTIRLNQQMYIDNSLPNLQVKDCLRQNQADLNSATTNDEKNLIHWVDENVNRYGDGSETESKQIENKVLVCAADLNHFLFIHPRKFVSTGVVEFGIEFFGKDIINSRSRFKLYYLNQLGDSCIPEPLGFVWIQKHQQKGYVCKHNHPKGAPCFKSDFEEDYEINFKKRMVSDQKNLHFATDRQKELYDLKPIVIETSWWHTSLTILKERLRKRYRMANMVKAYPMYTKQELEWLYTFIEADEILEQPIEVLK